MGAVLGLSTAGVRSMWMNGDLVVLGHGRSGIGVTSWLKSKARGFEIAGVAEGVLPVGSTLL